MAKASRSLSSAATNQPSPTATASPVALSRLIHIREGFELRHLERNRQKPALALTLIKDRNFKSIGIPRGPATAACPRWRGMPRPSGGAPQRVQQPKYCSIRSKACWMVASDTQKAIRT
jgi:hypothetical protein